MSVSPCLLRGSRITSHTSARSAYLLLKNGLLVPFLAPVISACALASAAASSFICSDFCTLSLPSLHEVYDCLCCQLIPLLPLGIGHESPVIYNMVNVQMY